MGSTVRCRTSDNLMMETDYSESWKPIIPQYDAQPRRIKMLIVLLFLQAP